jgi:hypothetical protein
MTAKAARLLMARIVREGHEGLRANRGNDVAWTAYMMGLLKQGWFDCENPDAQYWLITDEGRRAAREETPNE